MQTDLRNFYEQHLIDCIKHQCSSTKQHIDEHKRYFANNRHSSGYSDVWKQLTFALSSNRSEGAYIYDLDGYKYIDLTMGFGVHLFGHSPGFIRQAINSQLDKGFSVGPVHSGAGETASLICRMTHNERCAFFNSGTEAVMVALRLARAATGKSKVVIFEGAYHGTHDSLLAIKQHPVTKEAIGSIPGVPNSLVQDTIILPFGKQESLDFINEHAVEIAGVITEPVRSRHPEDVNPVFLRQLQEICQAKNISFILDEVITGFRIANGGAKTIFGLDPDLTIYGKVLGGGLPIGVVAGKKKWLDYIDGGNWSFSDDSSPYSPTTFVAGTFCHHPLAMSASKATLEFLLANNNSLQEELNNRTSEFCESVNGFCRENNFPVELLHFGSMFRFNVLGKTKLLYHALLKEKVYIWEGRNCFLSTAHEEDDLQQLKERIKKSLIEMRAAGFFSAMKNKIKLIEPGNSFLQVGFEVNGLLESMAMQFAFNYACENAGIVNQSCLSKEFLFFTDDIPGEMINSLCTETTIHVRLIMVRRNDKTFLLLQCAKKYFDGWSMILFTRFLNDCYLALEKEQPLPSSPFASKRLFDKWVGSDQPVKPLQHSYPASVIYRHLTLSKKNYDGTLLEYLLSCFGIALGKGRHVIGIPLSGQLASRNIYVMGNCTCQVPVSFVIEEPTTSDELTEVIKSLVKKAKNDFRNWYLKMDTAPFSIVFNMDNAGNNLFATRKITWTDTFDKHTCHDIMCNVIVSGDELYVTIKHKTGFSENEMEKLIDRFSSLITQDENILTYSR